MFEQISADFTTKNLTRRNFTHAFMNTCTYVFDACKGFK